MGRIPPNATTRRQILGSKEYQTGGFKCDPNQSILFATRVRINLRFWWNPCRILQLRNECALSAACKLPPVIRAGDGVVFDATARKGSSSMHANITIGMCRTVRVAPQHRGVDSNVAANGVVVSALAKATGCHAARRLAMFKVLQASPAV